MIEFKKEGHKHWYKIDGVWKTIKELSEAKGCPETTMGRWIACFGIVEALKREYKPLKKFLRDQRAKERYRGANR